MNYLNRNHPNLFAYYTVDLQTINRITFFLTEFLEISQKRIPNNMHLTIYHSRRYLPGVANKKDKISYSCETSESRLMVLFPGGENPIDDIRPKNKSIALRLTRRNSLIKKISSDRDFLINKEKKIKLSRNNSTQRKNAFGARHFQPHVKILYPKNKSPDDLSFLGKQFRNEIKQLTFDKYIIDLKL